MPRVHHSRPHLVTATDPLSHPPTRLAALRACALGLASLFAAASITQRVAIIAESVIVRGGFGAEGSTIGDGDGKVSMPGKVGREDSLLLVVATVFDGAYGVPLNGRRSTLAARIAMKRSLEAEAWMPELNLRTAQWTPGPPSQVSVVNVLLRYDE